MSTASFNNTVVNPSNIAANASGAATLASVVAIADAKPAVTEAEGVKLQQQRELAAYNRIAALSNERQIWNDTVYKTSNDMLYNVLQQCYALYFDMCGKTTEAGALREALAKHIAQRGIKVLKSTHTITKIVRCVFDGDRKRFNSYSRALQAAASHKPNAVPVDGLVDFIIASNGIEEIVRAKGPTDLTNADKALAARNALVNTVLAKVEEPNITQMLDAAKDGELHVAIVTQRAGGDIEINALVFSETVLKAALAAYYNTNKEQLTASTSNATTATTQVEQNKALEELAALAA